MFTLMSTIGTRYIVLVNPSSPLHPENAFVNILTELIIYEVGDTTNMPEDNNPFRPTLAKPVSDTMLANDPAPDNFLAGNDRLAQQANLDGVTGGHQAASAAPRLDQMPNGNVAGGQSDSQSFSDILSGTANAGSLADAVSADPKPVVPTSSVVAPEPTPANEEKSKKKKSKKGSLFSRKKKEKAGSDKPTDPAGNTSAVFGADLMASHASPLGFNPLDPVTPEGTPGVSVDDSGSSSTTPTGAGSDSGSPIGDALSAAAAMADSQTGDVTINKTPAKKKSASGQPKQLTISLLTIVFCVLFIISTVCAVYFAIQNGKSANQLSDTKAELQELRDKDNASSTTNSKTSDQFDALQNKIAGLTKQATDNKKTMDENKKTIEDLTKKNTDLTTQLNAANAKLASDKSVSDNMKSLVVTMCASGSEGVKNSPPCIALGQQNQNQPPR